MMVLIWAFVMATEDMYRESGGCNRLTGHTAETMCLTAADLLFGVFGCGFVSIAAVVWLQSLIDG